MIVRAPSASVARRPVGAKRLKDGLPSLRFRLSTVEPWLREEGLVAGRFANQSQARTGYQVTKVRRTRAGDVTGVAQALELVHPLARRSCLGDHVGDSHRSPGGAHALHLAQHRADIGEVMQGETAHHDLELRIGKRQGHGVGLDEHDVVAAFHADGLRSLLEHGGRDVSHNAQLGAPPEMPSQLAGATGDVEEPIARMHGDISGDPVKHFEVGKVRIGRLE